MGAVPVVKAPRQGMTLLPCSEMKAAHGVSGRRSHDYIQKGQHTHMCNPNYRLMANVHSVCLYSIKYIVPQCVTQDAADSHKV